MGGSSFDFPRNSPLVDKDGGATLPWLQLFARWHLIITSAAQSGPTSQRPVSGLYIGRRFFDTDIGADAIGAPIWCAQVKPSVVWVDAFGTTV